MSQIVKITLTKKTLVIQYLLCDSVICRLLMCMDVYSGFTFKSSVAVWVSKFGISL